MIQRYILYLLLLLCLGACKRHDGLSGVLALKSLNLQAVQLKNNKEDDRSVSFKVKLMFPAIIADEERTQLNNKLWYKADSSFYLLTTKNKINAALIQPVAGGVNGMYEYLLEFEDDKKIPGDSLALVFNDRYVNHKKYIIKLEK